ncbi:MAG: NUDIX hydrolase [Patescibacteria group bacterium]|jgi:ADP-ribose pyrophosphatase YjhB (NUDIX family)
MDNQYISNIISWNGQKVTFTWISTVAIEKYQPIRNVVGVCLNGNQEVLICRETKEEVWKLPGGRPENNETPIETLERELMEEVDIKVNNIKAIGTQRVDFPDNPKQSEGDLFYQVRYFCKIEKILPQTTDPDTGILYERKFIPITELNNYLKWGKIGEAIVAKVLEFENNK